MNTYQYLIISHLQKVMLDLQRFGLTITEVHTGAHAHLTIETQGNTTFEHEHVDIPYQTYLLNPDDYR